ncbi:hypothetical protein [Schaalia sp. lx-100]|uniref:hypothetical protein n=1 Tax=Schaalia sp. lx-100 TaxID=2899081 RepID=UPI001E5B89B2|nr:hypothetical protein [Schaalia sp. lx-100]MCD4557508.1 hypothetical protein [Schaalia sp. lx-100]
MENFHRRDDALPRDHEKITAASTASTHSRQEHADPRIQESADHVLDDATDLNRRDASKDAATGGSPSFETEMGTGPADVTDTKTEHVHLNSLEGMRTYICDSCGAEIIADPTTVSTRCGFCNNTFIATERLSETRVPDFIIPFALDKKAMQDAFVRATEGKYLLPPTFRRSHILQEATGAYVPYWFHDGSVSGTLHLRAQDVTTWTEGDYQCTQTFIFDVLREGSADFRAIPVCATSKLESERSEGVEPYDMADSREFSTAYLSGYAASTYDIEAIATQKRANERVTRTFEDLVRESVHGHQLVQVVEAHTHVEHANTWFALLPIWLIVVAYGGVNYPFAINGVTGEVVGEFPISTRRLWALRALWCLPLMLLAGVMAWIFI